MQIRVAIRLYDNPKFGKTFGKGMYYNAIYNGTLDFPVHNLKYLVDLLPYKDWQHTAKTDDDMEVLSILAECCAKQDIDIYDDKQNKNVMCSWIKRFDSPMLKPKINGFTALDLRTCKLILVLIDEEKDIKLHESFDVRACKQTDCNSPNYFAANYELDTNYRRAA